MPSPYLANNDADRQAMLRDIGVSSVEELFKDVPEKYRNANFKLPSPLSELELKEEMRQLSNRNANLEDYTCFLGAGYYRHFIPSVVGHITGRSEFYTAYTPYQAEVSQGTLQTIYEYQSLVCQLTGMEVSNAGMYDGSTAAAEAALMAWRITRKGKIAALSTVSPRYLRVIETYVSGHSIPLEKVEPNLDGLSADCACLVVQQPNFFGYFEDMAAYAQKAHGAGALLVAIVDPVSLGMFKSPADYGADIVVAEGQALGNPTSFGGPGLGIFTCRKDYLRQMPGRIVGKTVDVDGKPGYVLTMATREQHIRRERATSNICTNEALVALATAVYLATLGKEGLRQVAELCYHKAHYAASAIAKLEGYSLVFQQPFFEEFVVRCPVAPSQISDVLFKEGIIGGLDISDMIDNGMLFCVTEVNTKSEIDRLVEILGKFRGIKK
ncbi:MAG TPA: aminomethyl-transferring glycine dehydrogenase subunit GcvPA [Dehalococcoidales bacterium]|nr:aminomethyl-transferring glycine dehydrogenase subunit GcvPA [Dehalococcoidales bacterium]